MPQKQDATLVGNPRDRPRLVADFRRRFTPSSSLFSLVLIFDVLLIATAFVFSHYYGKDVLSSLTYLRSDGGPGDVNCLTGVSGVVSVGGHCFGDYSQVVNYASLANPWNDGFNYIAAGLYPNLIFGAIGNAIGAPLVGTIAYLVFLAAALMTPAVWASRGKVLSQQVITIAAFGLLSISSLMDLDRGNTVGLAVPGLLIFLVGLRRGKFWLVALAIVIVVLVKPQFVLLVVALAIARRWKQVAATIGAIVVTNLAAYLAWPQDFPSTIFQAMRNATNFGTKYSFAEQYPANISFMKIVYNIEEVVRSILGIPPSNTWAEANAGLLSFVSVAAIVGGVTLLGRRLPPHIGGICLMACASMFPSLSRSYYLVFGLAVAAILLRDPLVLRKHPYRWSGVLDGGLPTRGKKIAGAALVIATALSVTRVLLPVILSHEAYAGRSIVDTTLELVPMLWLVAIGLVFIGWGRDRPRRNIAMPLIEASGGTDSAGTAQFPLQGSTSTRLDDLTEAAVPRPA